MATDLHQILLDLGFELFQDREKMKDATFVAGDMLDNDDTGLRILEGKATIIHAANFFHLFSREAQLIAGTRMVKFLRSDANDALIFGKQIGSLEPGEKMPSSATLRSEGLFLHDQATFQALWDEIGQATRTKWKVEVEMMMKVPPGFEFLGEAARYSRFVVQRI